MIMSEVVVPEHRKQVDCKPRQEFWPHTVKSRCDDDTFKLGVIVHERFAARLHREDTAHLCRTAVRP